MTSDTPDHLAEQLYKLSSQLRHTLAARPPQTDRQLGSSGAHLIGVLVNLDHGLSALAETADTNGHESISELLRGLAREVATLDSNEALDALTELRIK